MSNVTYTMAQYRYSGSGCYNTLYNLQPVYKPSVSTNSSSEYQDLCFSISSSTPNNGATEFQANTDYYVTIKIRRDLIHDMTIDLKLSNMTNTEDAKQSDQYLDYVTIKKDFQTQEDDIVDVAYFCPFGEDDTKENRIVGKVEEKPATGEGFPNVLYRETGSDGVDKYYLQQEKGKLKEWQKYSVAKLSASWLTKESDDSYIAFDITFRPVANYSYLVLELERDPAIDPSVINEDGKRGRKISFVRGDCWCYDLIDLVPMMKQTGGMSSITRIGVWGQHGTLMCINGEPIKIGPSSYYEQDALPIETLAMCVGAGEWEKNFTIDYVGVKATTSNG